VEEGAVDIYGLNAAWIRRPDRIVDALPRTLSEGADFVVEVIAEIHAL
jgi:hypothetical protein